MDKIQLLKGQQTLEALDISGSILVYLDDQPFVRLNFSRKLRVYFDISSGSQASTAEVYSQASFESSGRSLVRDEFHQNKSLKQDRKFKYLVNGKKQEKDYDFSKFEENQSQLLECHNEQNCNSGSEVINLDVPLPAAPLHDDDLCSAATSTATFTSSRPSTQGSTTCSALQLPCPKTKKTALQLVSSCSYCHRSFHSDAEKESHHWVLECVRQCKQCEREFSSEAELFLHRYRKHDRQSLKQEYPELSICPDSIFNKFHCPICEKPLQSENIYHHLQLTHLPEESYSCCVCASTFKTHYCLQYHLTKHHGSKTKELTSYIEYGTVEHFSRPVTYNPTDEHTSQCQSVSSLNNESNKKVSVTGTKLSEKLGQSSNFNYRCNYCCKVFSKMEEKLSHARVADLKIKCPKCPSILPSQASLIIHDFQVHERTLNGYLPGRLSTKSFVCCPLCQKQTNQLKEHIAVFHIGEMLFQCCVCAQKFLTDIKLKRHCYRHLNPKTGRFKCSRCQFETDNRSAFLKHAATHRTECAICNTDFGHTHLLQSHMESQHADRLFTCKICGKKIATKDQLDTHMHYHRFNSTGKQCPICGTIIKSGLNKHIMRKHPKKSETSEPHHSDNQHTCSKCFKKFTSQINLAEHVRRNHTNHSSSCPTCGKTFSKTESLTKHIDKVHLNKDLRTYICELCGKRATSSYNLKVHMRIHSTSKLFFCDLCGQGFNYKASLQGHMKSKHKEDPEN